MDYRKLDKNQILKLTPSQAYIAACLSFKSDFITGESHIHQDTLAQFCHCSISKVQDAIAVFKEIGFIRAIKVHQFKTEKGEPRRENIYQLHIPEVNYFTICKGLLEKDTPSNLIGYVLILKCLCLNGTNVCYYNLKKIANKTTIGYSTLKGKNGLHQKAVNYGLIQSDKEKHTILDSNILSDESLNIPDLKDDKHQFEGVYVEQYKIIQSCCLKHHIYPPKYDKELMRLITSRYVDYDLEMVLNQRLPKIREKKIFSLKYIVKLLNLKEYKTNKEEEEEYVIIL